MKDLIKDFLKKFFEKRKWDYWWREWVKPVLIAGFLALLIRTFVIQPFKIPSNSMCPTLKPRDRIFVSKFIYGAKVPFTDIEFPDVRPPETGDIVVFLSPIEKKKYLVKRFIAGEGQKIKIADGSIFIDGKKIEEEPMKSFFYHNRGKYGALNRAVKVPEGHFYVLGDNSKNSMDSRYWGHVPEKNLVGKAFIVHWPLRRIHLLRKGN